MMSLQLFHMVQFLSIAFLSLNFLPSSYAKYDHSTRPKRNFDWRPAVRRSPSNFSRVQNARSSAFFLKSYRDVIVLENEEINFISPYEPIFKPCDLLLSEFTEVAENFTECVTANSLPPRVCTRCADYYVAFEQAYYKLRDSSDAKTSEGVPCDQVIFSMYDTAYVQDLYDVLTGDIWSASECTDCLEFVISPQFTSAQGAPLLIKPAGNFRYNNRTEKVLSLYSRLYECIRNAGGTAELEDLTEKNASVVCSECWKAYQDLNLYYEESILSQRDFCVDIDSAINDTIRFWRQALACAWPTLPAKRSEAVIVALMSLALFALTIIFYSGSFMQGSRKKRRLRKYRSGFQFGSVTASINNDIIQEYVTERQRRSPEASVSTGRSPGERTPLLFAGGRRVISYSQLPPSNLG